MAVINDVMPAFELFQPTTTDDALALLGQYRSDAWVFAGGLDSFDWLKDRIKRPKVVVDLSQIKELKGVRSVDGGLEIGAMTTLTEVVRHPVVREKYSILAEAAEAAASPQIRNQGTIGGNVTARCAVLVLPRRLALLSRWRQHLLRGYSIGHEPRARHFERGPLRRGQSVGFSSGVDRA